MSDQSIFVEPANGKVKIISSEIPMDNDDSNEVAKDTEETSSEISTLENIGNETVG